MQVITSLLSLQASNAPSEHRGMYEDSLRRISTMSLIHEQLNDRSALTDVDFSQYLRRLCKSLEDAYGLSDVAVRVAACPIGFNLETATPLALIVNEVLSNAFKHAFPDGRSGTIAVALSEQDGHISLEISDDGIGSGGEIPGGRKRGLGIRLIEAMCRQLQASCAFTDHGGTIFRLSFQRPPSPPSA
jgi:two-component sensor histidine kinase